MAFLKQADSNISNVPNQIVGIIYNKKCEKCETDLNMLKSKDGVIICVKCGFSNMISKD